MEEHIDKAPYSASRLEEQLDQPLSKLLAPIPYSNLVLSTPQLELFTPLAEMADWAISQ